MAEYSEKDVDVLYETLRWNGLYQAAQFGLLCVSKIPVAFGLFSVIFIGYHVPGRCKEANSTWMYEDTVQKNVTDVNITYNECDVVVHRNVSGYMENNVQPCVHGYQYSDPTDLSLVSEWDLVCGKESLSDLLQTLNMFGMALGATVFGILADSKGRKMSHILSTFLLLIVGIGMAFVPSYVPFAVLKVVQGASEMGVTMTASTLAIEMVPTVHRSKIHILNRLAFPTAMVIYALTAYLMRNISWRYHQLVVGLVGCYVVFLPWERTTDIADSIRMDQKVQSKEVLPWVFFTNVATPAMHESFRWLGTKKKFDQIEANLRNAARMNGKDAKAITETFRQKLALNPLETDQNLIEKSVCDKEHDNPDISYADGRAQMTITEEGPKPRRPILQLFRDTRFLKVTGVISAMWFIDSMTYYGLHMISTEFHSNKYIGFGLNALMEIVSMFAFWLTVDRFGRKKSSVGFRLLAGLSLLVGVLFGNFTDAVPSFHAVVTTLSLLGKFAITISYSILWLYTPEVFPTTIRNAGLGIGLMFGRIGGLLAPFSRTLLHYYPWAMGTISGSCCILVTFISRVLPETAGYELTKSISEMRKLIRAQKTLRK